MKELTKVIEYVIGKKTQMLIWVTTQGVETNICPTIPILSVFQPESSALQTDSLPPEPTGKPIFLL